MHIYLMIHQKLGMKGWKKRKGERGWKTVIRLSQYRSSHVMNNYQLDFKQLQREGVGCDQKKGQMFEVTEM